MKKKRGGGRKITVYKQKNLISNYLYLKIMVRSVQLLAITAVPDSLQTQANIFFGHSFVEVTLLFHTHTHTHFPFGPLKKFQFTV